MSVGESFAVASVGSTQLSAALGPLLIGGLVSAILYGITCIQTLLYYKQSRSDPRYLRLLIIVLWLIDTFDMVLNGHILYWYMVVNYVNPSALVYPVWSILVHVPVTSVSNFLVRGMFIYRVWRLSQRNIFLIWFIFTLSLLELACGIGISVKAFHFTFDGLEALSTWFYLDFAAIFTADASVALSLCYYLHKSKPGLQRTDSLLNTLMMYTINTGLLTAIDASAGLILFAVMPRNLIYVAFYLLLSKLYLNAYLSSLNARASLCANTDDTLSINLGPFSAQRSNSQRTSTNTSIHLPTPIDKRDTLSIMVSTQVDTHVDIGDKDSSRTGRRVDGRHPRRQPGPKVPDPILEGNPASPLASPVNDISDELSAEIDLEWLKYAD